MNLEIHLKTLTPLWTGGVDRTTDRLHETGLIGSLRWWYEALVRGLGGYACDPTSEKSEERCQFDSKAYETAKRDGKSEGDAIRAGLHTVCPVCYLFGCTGWARLFQLRAIEVPTTDLHFRTTLRMNQGWLKRVFGGESRNIDSLKVPYGNLRLQFIPRRLDAEYAKSQFALILHLAANYGGIGARLQHGFGQFVFPPELNDVSLTDGIRQLKHRLQEGFLRSTGPVIDTPFDLRNFISLTYEVPQNKLADFMNVESHVGSPVRKGEKSYFPCVFDLRYKGQEKWGFRQWLKGRGWKETNNPRNLEELDILLGPRSQWGPKGREVKIDEDFRTAGRVFFGMPYRKDDNRYILRVWAFWPPELKHKLQTPEKLRDLCIEYVHETLQVEPASAVLGQDILK